MADIHAVDYPLDGEGRVIPDESGIFSTQDFVFAALLGTLNFRMRGRQPAAISFNGNNIANTLRQPGGNGNFKLCQTVFYFFVEGPVTVQHGPLYYQKVYAAYFLARLYQRERREGKTEELEKLIKRAAKCAMKHGVREPLLDEVLGYIDLAANIFVLAETIEELAKDPFISFAQKLSRPGGITHVVQPLNQESKVMDHAQRLHIHKKR